ncbi:hypothetical protein HK100_002983 [Physocladia obscura]|uniref:PH domain-containing protein n=1 Tax=Physocladia obscura TaxID=109957 RepID=A0AAD5SV02_9FUNG|nr:hypothetical protein HK100_002983 [Physocladia obscura]
MSQSTHARLDSMLQDIDAHLDGFHLHSDSYDDKQTDVGSLSGYLNIVFNANGDLARRFFVLSGRAIFMFASSSQSEYSLDQFHVTRYANILENSATLPTNPFAFELVDDRRLWIAPVVKPSPRDLLRFFQYSLTTTSQLSKETWMDMIKLLISRSSEPSIQTPPQLYRSSQHSSGSKHNSFDAPSAADELKISRSGSQTSRNNSRRAYLDGSDDVYRRADNEYSRNSKNEYERMLREQHSQISANQEQFNTNGPHVPFQSGFHQAPSRGNTISSFPSPRQTDSVSSYSGPVYSRKGSFQQYPPSLGGDKESLGSGYMARPSSDYNKTDSLDGPATPGIPGGGVFGSPAVNPADSIKSADSDKDKKKKSHHKAQMAKGFVQF